MSLATRCPVCQTVFRVVQDQLKVSEGWVRCGRCAKVFNAFEGLFDLEREFPALRQPTPSQRVLEDLATRNRQPKQPSQWDDGFDSATRAPEPAARAGTPVGPATPRTTAPTPTVPRVAPASTATPAPGAASAMPRDATLPVVARAPQSAGVGKEQSATSPRPRLPAAEAARTAAETAGPPPSPAPATTAQVATPVVAPQPVPAPAAPAPVAARAAADEIAIRDEPAPVPGAEVAEAAAQDESFDALFRSDGELAQPDTAADLDINLDSDVEPAALDDAVDSRLLTFVQEADRAERWRRPWVRAALAAAALVLTFVLVAQLLVAQRDAVVAQWPGMRSWVQALCAPFDCRIEALRRIDSLGVDSSGLTRIDDGPVYRLVLVLHNRGDKSLQIPAIDLSLTDAAGILVTRRVLSAADLGTPRTTIGAGQELPLQALLMSADRPLAGYTIEIFYP